MPFCQTKYLGLLDYNTGSAIEFPEGLPAFEQCRKFLLIDRPDLRPLVFMQSLEDPGLCFLTVPAAVAMPGYTLEFPTGDRALNVPRRPAIGADVLCLAIVSIRETGPTANLLAPIVIDPKTMRAAQVILPEAGYSHQHPLGTAEEVVPC